MDDEIKQYLNFREFTLQNYLIRTTVHKMQNFFLTFQQQCPIFGPEKSKDDFSGPMVIRNNFLKIMLSP